MEKKFAHQLMKGFFYATSKNGTFCAGICTYILWGKQYGVLTMIVMEILMRLIARHIHIQYMYCTSSQIYISLSSFLKGQRHEIFYLWFFLQTVPPGPSRHAQKRFQFFSIIRRDIRLFWCFDDAGNACIAGVLDISE
jgi:hypothetical protein